MEINFRKKKKATYEEIEIASDKDCRSFEEDAQTYFKGARLRREKEQINKEVEKKKNSEEKEKKRKEKEAYCLEIKKIYQNKKKV